MGEISRVTSSRSQSTQSRPATAECGRNGGHAGCHTSVVETNNEDVNPIATYANNTPFSRLVRTSCFRWERPSTCNGPKQADYDDMQVYSVFMHSCPWLSSKPKLHAVTGLNARAMGTGEGEEERITLLGTYCASPELHGSRWQFHSGS